jgi:phenylpropionate dioxygenase-like ring-hydroxylating dioxygenase large terminal subunit
MLLRNFWYSAAYAKEIKQELLARTILSEPVVMYRKRDGRAVALQDRCIHRRVSLSLGRLIDDRVQCGYHGLQYDDTGKCVLIPGQESIPPQACIKSYPVEERDNILWIWMGNPALANRDDIPDYSFCSSPKFAGRFVYEPLRTTYQMSVDNLVDLSHIGFAHPQTVGNAFVAEFKPQVKVNRNRVTVTRHMPNVDNAPLFRRTMGLDRVDRVQEINFWPGGNIHAISTVSPVGSNDPELTKTVHTLVQITPETEKSVFLISAMYRDFEIDNEKMTEMMADQLVKTICEDRAVTENELRNWDADGAEAPMVDIMADRGPFAARRIIRQIYEQENRTAAE